MPRRRSTADPSAGFAAAYAALRIVLVAQYARARQIDSARELATRYLIGHGDCRRAVAGIRVCHGARAIRHLDGGVCDRSRHAVDRGRHSVEVPPDGAHLPERFGLFTLILLGESVVAVMHGMQSQEDWSVPAATASRFSAWPSPSPSGGGISMAPRRRPSSTSDRRATRSGSTSGATLHLPFYLGVAVAGVGIERIVHSGAAEACTARTG